jgi:hypothetical protein
MINCIIRKTEMQKMKAIKKDKREAKKEGINLPHTFSLQWLNKVKANLSQDLFKYYAITFYEGVEIQLHHTDGQRNSQLLRTIYKECMITAYTHNTGM